MNFDYTPKQKEWMRRVGDFMDKHVYPNEQAFRDQLEGGPAPVGIAHADSLIGCGKCNRYRRYTRVSGW